MKHLYHGTTAKQLRAILKHGLRPRGTKRSKWPDLPSRPDHVYLSVAYPIHYAKNATNDNEHAAIIRIDPAALDPADLYADEDALEQANRQQDIARWPTMEERTAWYRDSWRHLPQAKMWRDSLDYIGNCSHHGAIPASAITGVAIIQRNTHLWHMSDPTITRINYRIMGNFYRALTAYPFEGKAAIDREEEEAIGGGFYLKNLAQVTTGFKAFETPLPAATIIAAANAERIPA